MSKLLDTIPRKLRRALTLRFDRRPFDSLERLAEFVQTRAAYVAQTSLYGYLKTRMGTRYRVMFEDEVFARSINYAKWRIYASCLSDLAVFSAATVRDKGGLANDAAAGLAHFCFASAIAESFADADEPDLAEQVKGDFLLRLEQVDWTSAAIGENAFISSPDDLIKWAPIADELKALDEDIVVNSIRFRWRDVREQLRTRLDADAISLEWRNAHPNAQHGHASMPSGDDGTR